MGKEREVSLEAANRVAWGAPPIVGPGHLVRCRRYSWGVAKCVGVEAKGAVLQYWQAHDAAVEVIVGRLDLEWVEIAPGTRCFLSSAKGAWLAARVLARLPEPRRYLVETALEGPIAVDERELYVPCLGSVGRPEELAALAGFDPPDVARDRWAFIRAGVEQRARCRGLTALLSSSIELYPHQIEVARRVLESGAQRYLLGDEVGLGKTIEAGLVLRQYLIDERDGQALVIVPASLKDQWRREMVEKFRAGYFAGRIEIVCPEDFERADFFGRYGLVIVDEAHQVVEGAFTQEGRATACYQTIARLAHRAPRTVLLSATPISAEPLDLLAMLHLIDPEQYRLDRPGPFYERLKWRGEIGKALLRLRPGSPPADLAKAAETLAGMFPRDAVLGAWLGELRSELAQGSAAEANETLAMRLAAIRDHVASRHRLHHRLLRNRRQAVDAAGQAGLGDLPGRFGFEQLGEPDHRQRAIEAALEAWRRTAWKSTQAIADPDRLGERRRALREVFRYMVAAAGSSPMILTDLAAARRDGVEPKGFMADWPARVRETIVGPETFKGESALLDALQDACDGGNADADPYSALDIELTNRLADAPSAKIVVFSGFTRVAQAIAGHLAENIGAKVVATHLANQPRQDQDRGLQRFRGDPVCRVLVADASAEEGRNLQFASVVLHFDLPWHPNRLEQRIGRLDRIGRRGWVGNLVLTAGSPGGQVAAWLRVLDEGFGIFTRSIACLQLYTDRKLRKLDELRFRDGASGLVAHLDTLRDEVAAEWEGLELQAAIDEADLLDAAAQEFFETLVQADRQCADFVAALEGWICRQLGAERLPLAGAPGVFKYGPPLRWQGVPDAGDVLKLGLNQPLAADRTVVRRFADVGLLRVGSAAFEAFAASLAADDRGAAYMRWCRVAEGAIPAPVDQQAHACHMVVEADREAIRKAGAQARLGEGAIATAIRLADALMPPLTHVVYLNGALEPLANPVREALQASPIDDEWREPVSERARLLALDALRSAGFSAGWSAVVNAARRVICSEPGWEGAVDQAVRRAEALPADVPLRAALRASVAEPAIRLEVYGLLIASARTDPGLVEAAEPKAWPAASSWPPGVRWSEPADAPGDRPKRPPILSKVRRKPVLGASSSSAPPPAPTPTADDLHARPAVCAPTTQRPVDPARGQELRARRTGKGISQGTLSRASGVSAPTISLIETGRRAATDTEWAALADALATFPDVTSG